MPVGYEDPRLPAYWMEWQRRTIGYTKLAVPFMSANDAREFLRDYRLHAYPTTAHDPNYLLMVGRMSETYTLKLDQDTPATRWYKLFKQREAYLPPHLHAKSPLDMFLRVLLFYFDTEESLAAMHALASEMASTPDHMVGLVFWAIRARQTEGTTQSELTFKALVHLCNLLLRFYGTSADVSVLTYNGDRASFVLEKKRDVGTQVVEVSMPRLVSFWFGGFQVPNVDYGAAAHRLPTNETLFEFFKVPWH